MEKQPERHKDIKIQLQIKKVRLKMVTHCQHQPGREQAYTGLWTCAGLRIGRWLCCGASWNETEPEAEVEARWDLETDERSEEHQ